MNEGKTRYVTHEEALRNAMKDPEFRFWYYVMKPKFWAIRFWMWVGRALGIAQAESENRKEAYVEGFVRGSDWLRWREHGWTSFSSERHEAEAAAVMKWEARPRRAAFMARIGRPNNPKEPHMPDPKKIITDFVKKDDPLQDRLRGFWYCEYCDSYLGEAEQPDHSKHEEFCLLGAIADLVAQAEPVASPPVQGIMTARGTRPDFVIEDEANKLNFHCLICGSDRISFVLGYGSRHDGEGVCFDHAKIVDAALQAEIKRLQSAPSGDPDYETRVGRAQSILKPALAAVDRTLYPGFGHLLDMLDSALAGGDAGFPGVWPAEGHPT